MLLQTSRGASILTKTHFVPYWKHNPAIKKATPELLLSHTTEHEGEPKRTFFMFKLAFAATGSQETLTRIQGLWAFYLGNDQ